MAAGATRMDEGTQLSILLPTLHLDSKFLLVLAMEMMREKVVLRGNHMEKRSSGLREHKKEKTFVKPTVMVLEWPLETRT